MPTATMPSWPVSVKHPRAVWSAGALVFLAHAAAAFHFVHGWSHAEALRHTARQTHEVVGLDWGGGLYVNYVFAACWLIDAALVWRACLRRERLPAWYTTTVGALLWFLVINATLVFGPRGWLAVAVAWLALLAIVYRRRTRQSGPPPAT